jgi:CHAT domain-containing protein/Tfp pilus assembly protein PilF
MSETKRVHSDRWLLGKRLRGLIIVAVMVLLGVTTLLANPSHSPWERLSADSAVVSPSVATQSNEVAALELLNEGKALFFEGTEQAMRQAVTKYLEALTIYRELSNVEGQGIMLTLLAEVYEKLGETEKALDSYQQALPLWGSINERRNVCYILNSLGEGYLNLRNIGKALESHQKALTIAQDLRDDALLARTYNGFGTLYYSSGDNPKAIDNFKLAQRHARLANRPSDEATSHLGLGLISLSQGEFRAAIESYDRALEIYRQDKNVRGTAIALMNTGGIYYSLNDYKAALRKFDEARQAAAAGNERDLEVALLINIGAIYDDTGEADKALELYGQALDKSSSIGFPQGEVAILNNIGRVYQRLDEYERALSFYQRALSRGDEIGFDPHIKAVLLHNSGFIYQKLGKTKLALQKYLESLEIKRTIGFRQFEGNTLAMIGDLYENEGLLEKALEYYQQAIQVSEKIHEDAGLEEFKTSVAHQTFNVYHRALLLLSRFEKKTEAFALSEKGRARTFLDQLSNTQLRPQAGADTRLIARQQELLREIREINQQLTEENIKPGALLRGDFGRSLEMRLDLKQREYNEVLIQLKASNPEYASLVSGATLSLDEVRAHLDDETTLLDYFVTRGKTLVFIIKRDSFVMKELWISEKDLTNAYNSFRSFPTLDELDLSNLQKLYQSLIAPIKPNLTTRRIGIIPHGVLNYVPFPALVSGENSKGNNGSPHYLIDDYTIFYLPSASVLPFIERKSKNGTDRLLAVSQSQAQGLAILNTTDDVAESVAKLYRPASQVIKPPTESSLRRLVGGSNSLFIAAHGKLDITNPLFSRIILDPDRPGNGGAPQSKSNENDGFLEVHEVYELDLKNMGLVVLSACQTQLGKRYAGDDIVGLNRAFIYAGTPTVVASLWSVKEKQTGELMNSFYKHFKCGMSKAEALRAAQIETRSHHPHPYFWAAFVLTGDPGTSSTPSARVNACLQQ